MHFFTDKNNTKWVLELNVGTAKRVRRDCQIDLIDGIESMERLAAEPILLVDVLFSLCREQCEKNKIDDFMFACLIDGDTIERAAAALLDEIINFSPPAKRKALAYIREKARSFAEEMNARLEAALNDPELNATIESELRKSFTVTPESSDSTPPPTPSAN